MIQQITKNIGIHSYNQIPVDQGNSGTLAVIRNNETALLSLRNRYQYNRDQLYELRLIVVNDNRYKLIEPERCITIRQLRLNKHKRGKRGGTRKDKGHKHNYKSTRGINRTNLVQVYVKPMVDHDQESNGIKQLHLLLSNIQSIKNKELQLLEHLNNNRIDIAVVIETWLSEDTDKAWVLTSELNRNGFNLETSNRIGRRGGGLAIISRPYLKTRKIMEGNQKTFQYAVWKVETHGNTVTCIAIYRPPYSATNQETVAKFVEEFTVWLANISGSFSNMIVLGDFNIHINDENDNEASIFVDTMTALGFNQHVSFPMHRAGNILDLVFTETCNSIEVKTCTPGPIFSDHTAIEIVVTQPIQYIQKRLIKYRKLMDININQLTNDLEVSNIINGPIDDMVDELESKLLQALDKHAPEKTKMVTVRHRLPWYTDEIKEQKRRIRRRERVWQKYKLESNWIALKEERTRYRLMLS